MKNKNYDAAWASAQATYDAAWAKAWASAQATYDAAWASARTGPGEDGGMSPPAVRHDLRRPRDGEKTGDKNEISN